MMVSEVTKRIPRGSLLIAGILALLIFAVQLHEVTDEMGAALFQAQWDEKVNTVNLLCDDIDLYVLEDRDWGVYDYAQDICHEVRGLDAWPQLFAGAYNERLNLLSNRVTHAGELPLDPLSDTAIVRAVTQTDSSEISQVIAVGDRRERVRVYYRWVPSGPGYSSKILIMVAMRETPLASEPVARLTRWCIALIAVAGAVLLAAGIDSAIQPREGVTATYGSDGQGLSGVGDSGANGRAGCAGADIQPERADAFTICDEPDVCGGVYRGADLLAAGHAQSGRRADVRAGGDSGVCGTDGAGQSDGAGIQADGPAAAQLIE